DPAVASRDQRGPALQLAAPTVTRLPVVRPGPELLLAARPLQLPPFRRNPLGARLPGSSPLTVLHPASFRPRKAVGGACGHRSTPAPPSRVLPRAHESHAIHPPPPLLRDVTVHPPCRAPRRMPRRRSRLRTPVGVGDDVARNLHRSRQPATARRNPRPGTPVLVPQNDPGAPNARRRARGDLPARGPALCGAPALHDRWTGERVSAAGRGSGAPVPATSAFPDADAVPRDASRAQRLGRKPRCASVPPGVSSTRPRRPGAGARGPDRQSRPGPLPGRTITIDSPP